MGTDVQWEGEDANKKCDGRQLTGSKDVSAGGVC